MVETFGGGGCTVSTAAPVSHHLARWIASHCDRQRRSCARCGAASQTRATACCFIVNEQRQPQKGEGREEERARADPKQGGGANAQKKREADEELNSSRLQMRRGTTAERMCRQLHEDDLALRAVADAERFNTVFLQQCLAWNRKSKQPANEATDVSPEVSPLFRRHRPASSNKPRQQQQQQPAPQRHQGMSVQDIVAGLKTPAPGRPGGPPHGAVFEKLEIRR